MEVGRGEGVGVTDGAGEADGFEGLVSVVEVDERVDAARLSIGDVVVKGVETAVEAGAGVEEGDEGVRWGVGWAERKVDGG